jgi:hypothetical protein
MKSHYNPSKSPKNQLNADDVLGFAGQVKEGRAKPPANAGA